MTFELDIWRADSSGSYLQGVPIKTLGKILYLRNCSRFFSSMQFYV